LKSKNLEDAFSSYKRAISLYPDLFWEVAEKAVRLTKDYRKLKLLIPEEAEAHYMFAQYFDRIGLSAESEAEYLEAIRLGPHNLDYRKSFAISLSNQNRHKVAIEELDKALKEAKDKAAIHLVKAEVYSRMEDLDKTILEYQQALALKPKDAKIYFDMGLFLQNKNEISKAIEAFRTAISLSPPQEIKYSEHLIDLCLKEKKYFEAVKELKRICQFNPKNVYFHFCLAQVYEKLEMREEAIQVYRKILELQPQNKEALSKIKPLKEAE